MMFTVGAATAALLTFFALRIYGSPSGELLDRVYGLNQEKDRLNRVLDEKESRIAKLMADNSELEEALKHRKEEIEVLDTRLLTLRRELNVQAQKLEAIGLLADPDSQITEHSEEQVSDLGWAKLQTEASA